MERNITLKAQHLPGVANTIADADTMEHDRQSTCTNKASESQAGDSYSSLEFPGLVPNIVGNANRLPKADTPEGEPDSAITSGSDARRNTPASHVEYLRDRYRECMLQQKLQNSSLHHGERNHQRATTHYSGNGSAGVVKGIQIQFWGSCPGKPI